MKTIDLDNAKKENIELQEEYQKYKNRANILFQQYSENNVKMKIEELEELNSKLEEEKRCTSKIKKKKKKKEKNKKKKKKKYIYIYIYVYMYICIYVY